MAIALKKRCQDEARLCTLLLHKRLVTEGQLKAAVDYQNSLGTPLADALVKLGVVRPQQLEDLLHGPDTSSRVEGSRGGGGAGEAPQPDREHGHGQEKTPEAERTRAREREHQHGNQHEHEEEHEEERQEEREEEHPEERGREADPGRIPPETVHVADLKVHRKLLEKLPRDLVVEHLLVLFLPPSGLSQRKIVLGHGLPLAPEVRERVQSVLGIEVSCLELDSDVVAGLLGDLGYGAALGREPERSSRRGGRSHQEGAGTARAEEGDALDGPREAQRQATPQRTPVATADILVPSLVRLLVKKGILTREEIEKEIELESIRRRHEA